VLACKRTPSDVWPENPQNPTSTRRIFDLAAEHELTHLLLRYGNGRGGLHPLLDEGLGSYVSEAIQGRRGPDGHLYTQGDFPAVYGYSADAWVKALMERSEDVPLSHLFGMEMQDIRRDKTLQWKGYIEASSFVRWYVDQHGWDGLWGLYDRDPDAVARLDEDLGAWKATIAEGSFAAIRSGHYSAWMAFLAS
jgi:hypothetical protein